MDLVTLLSLVSVTGLFSAGAAWGGTRVALNGTRERVKKLEDDVSTARSERGEIIARLIRIETKVDERTTRPGR